MELHCQRHKGNIDANCTVHYQKENNSLSNKTNHVIQENLGENVIQLQMTSSFSILRASKIQLIASLILFFDFKSHLAIALGHSRLIHWFYCTFNQSLACRKIVAFMFTLSHPHSPQTQLKGAFYLDSQASSSKDTLQKSRELDNEVEVTTSTHTHFY